MRNCGRDSCATSTPKKKLQPEPSPLLMAYSSQLTSGAKSFGLIGAQSKPIRARATLAKFVGAVDEGRNVIKQPTRPAKEASGGRKKKWAGIKHGAVVPLTNAGRKNENVNAI